jgi:hypothetical protein
MRVDNKETAKEIFTLTPLGLITSILGDNTDAKIVADQIELYLRRNNVGIVIDDNRLSFGNLQKIEKEK